MVNVSLGQLYFSVIPKLQEAKSCQSGWKYSQQNNSLTGIFHYMKLFNIMRSIHIIVLNGLVNNLTHKTKMCKSKPLTYFFMFLL